MIFHKYKTDDRSTIINELYDDEIVTYCPTCGKEYQLEPWEVAEIINTGNDFSGTSYYCNGCLPKGDTP